MSDRHTKTSGEDALDLRVGEILNAFLDARARGETVSEPELLARHPDLADELREHLALLSDLHPAAGKIESLIARGILARCEDPRYPAALGPYKVAGFIGRGGMGVVLEAYEESLNRTVALKILRPELTGDAAALARFTREAKAAAALRHPNIVTIYAVGAERGVHYIAMEHVDGPSLAEVIRETPAVSRQPSAGAMADAVLSLATGGQATSGTPLSPGAPSGRGAPATGLPTEPAAPATGPLAEPRTLNPEPSLPTDAIRSIFRQLLSALAAAHEAGLIHRDVKSSNILLEQGPRGQGVEGPRGGGLRPRAADSGAPSLRGVGDRSTRSASESPEPPSPGPSIPRSPPSVKLADFGLARVLGSQTRMTATDSILGTPEYMSPEQARGDEDIDRRTDLYSAGVVLYEMLTGRTPFKADKPSAVIHQILHIDPPDPRKLRRGVDPALASLALRLMAKRPQDRLPSATDGLHALDAGERVWSPQRRRKVLRVAATTLGTLALLIATVWGCWQLLLKASFVTAVRVEHDVSKPRSVEVRYGDSADWHIVAWPPVGSYGGVFKGAALVDPGGGRRPLVAVLGDMPFDAQGNVLVAFDQKGRKRWPLGLTPKRASLEWPDCDRQRDYWYGATMAVGDVDGAPGEEIVVVARDVDYPSRISIVDAETGTLRATLWHIGHINHVLIVRDYFEPGRPAIAAAGVNNKLDGFDDGSCGEPGCITKHDLVPAVMILDPRATEGVGPPYTDDLDLRPVMPWAYAFLDLAGSETRTLANGDRVQASSRSEVVVVETLALRTEAGANDSSPCFTLKVHSMVDEERRPDRCEFVLDRDLSLLRAEPADTELHLTDPADWEGLWHPIIQSGEWVAQ